MKTCPNCNNTAPDQAKFCPNCRHEFDPSKKISIPVLLLAVAFLLIIIVFIFRNSTQSTLTPETTPSASTILTETSTPTAFVLTSTPTNISTTPSSASTSSVATPDKIEPTKTKGPSKIPVGKIVYTCQVFRNSNRNQICIMNADGSDQRRLTNKDNVNSWYPSLAPDGQSIVFSSNLTGEHEIYEMDLDGNQSRLTSMGELYAPEISPNGQYIVFTNANGTYSSIWIMDRNGANLRAIYQPNDNDAVDPTWSPDGRKILFALGQGNSKNLYTINQDGSALKLVNQSFTTRGRSDWSPDGNKIAGYTGGSWKRIVSIMKSDGSGLSELYAEGNVQAPSFSPDSGWVTFTGYIDNMGNDDGCEIYIIKIVDNELKRLTNNNYCDWQPRWGL